MNYRLSINLNYSHNLIDNLNTYKKVNIPSEILLNIYKYLDYETRLNFRLVNRQYYSIFTMSDDYTNIKNVVASIYNNHKISLLNELKIYHKYRKTFIKKVKKYSNINSLNYIYSKIIYFHQFHYFDDYIYDTQNINIDSNLQFSCFDIIKFDKILNDNKPCIIKNVQINIKNISHICIYFDQNCIDTIYLKDIPILQRIYGIDYNENDDYVIIPSFFLTKAFSDCEFYLKLSIHIIYNKDTTKFLLNYKNTSYFFGNNGIISRHKMLDMIGYNSNVKCEIIKNIRHKNDTNIPFIDFIYYSKYYTIDKKDDKYIIDFDIINTNPMYNRKCEIFYVVLDLPIRYITSIKLYIINVNKYKQNLNMEEYDIPFYYEFYQKTVIPLYDISLEYMKKIEIKSKIKTESINMLLILDDIIFKKR